MCVCGFSFYEKTFTFCLENVQFLTGQGMVRGEGRVQGAVWEYRLSALVGNVSLMQSTKQELQKCVPHINLFVFASEKNMQNILKILAVG